MQTKPGHINQIENTICAALRHARQIASACAAAGDEANEQVWVDVADSLLVALDRVDDATD